MFIRTKVKGQIGLLFICDVGNHKWIESGLTRKRERIRTSPQYNTQWLAKTASVPKDTNMILKYD